MRLLTILAPSQKAAIKTCRRLTGSDPVDLVLVDPATRQDVQAWLELLRREFRTAPSERPSTRPSFLPRRK